jgi:WD40 repeat protein
MAGILWRAARTGKFSCSAEKADLGNKVTWTSPRNWTHAQAVSAVAFHPENDDIFATGSEEDRTVRLWVRVSEDWSEFAKYPIHTAPLIKLMTLAFDFDGNVLIATTTDGERRYSCEECGSLDELLALAKARPLHNVVE